MKAVRFIPAAALAACIVLTACSDYVGKEATHPLYAKYETSKSAKSYREAADSLEEFLTICPKSPKAHKDAAMLYKENLENYPAAIYHLLKYLELSGETLSKQDQEVYRGYIRDCERKMFETYRVRNDIKLADEVPQTDPAKLAAKDNEIAALRKRSRRSPTTRKSFWSRTRNSATASTAFPARRLRRAPSDRRLRPAPVPPLPPPRLPLARAAASFRPPRPVRRAPRSQARTACATTTWRRTTDFRPSRRRCTARRPCGRSSRRPTRKRSANAAS